MSSPVLWGVMGPTASGKSELAEAIAEARDAVLINADAFQVYRGFDVGTAKPIDTSRYRLIDTKDPTESYGVGEWVVDACQVLEELFEERRDAVVVGGTGFYIRALFEEYREMKPPPDPSLRKRLEELENRGGLPVLQKKLEQIDPQALHTVDLRNPVRVRRALERALTPSDVIDFHVPSFEKIKVAIMPNIAELSSRIVSRSASMLNRGWPEEVGALLSKKVPTDAPAYRAIGYQELRRAILDETPMHEVQEEVVQTTKGYAKRQLTWLRTEPNLSLVFRSSINRTNVRTALAACLTLPGR